MKNPARIVDELYRRFAAIDGFRRFMDSVSVLSSLASTPGWHDANGHPTQPGAKPIGLAQWGDAQIIAGLITEAVRGAPWPEPGVDTDDAGYILLQWKIADNAQLDLEFRHGMQHKKYTWTTIREGMKSDRYASDDPTAVIASLRSVMVGAQQRQAS
jgi:hypothetical protein